jgi:bisphosphoglycerate-independent phosphoglycerate mutase (AlkP superfamily)
MFCHRTGRSSSCVAKYFAYANAEAAPLIPSAHEHTIHYFAGHGLQLMDMAPTILAHMGVPIPPDMQGRVF